MFWGLLCCHIDHALLEGSSSYGFTKFLHWFFRSLDHVLEILSREHWRKLPYLTAFLKIFLYLKNNCKTFCFYTESGRSGCFEFWVWFSSVILLPKKKVLFFSLSKFSKFIMSFLKAQVKFCINPQCYQT